MGDRTMKEKEIKKTLQGREIDEGLKRLDTYLEEVVKARPANYAQEIDKETIDFMYDNNDLLDEFKKNAA